jgi:hypothetical protein
MKLYHALPLDGLNFQPVRLAQEVSLYSKMR